MNLYLTPAQRKRRRFIFRLKLYILFFVLSLASIGIFYFLENSVFWRIEKFEISGNKRLSAGQIISNLKPMILTGFTGKFLGFNHYLSWLSYKDIYLTSPNFANLTVSGDLFKKEIKIDVEEKEPYGVWCRETYLPVGEAGIVVDNKQKNADTNGENPRNNLRESALDRRESASMSCWWFDKEGLILELAPYSEGPLIFRILDLSDAPMIVGNKVLDEKSFNYLTTILEAVKELDFSVESFIFDKKLEEFNAESRDGSKILFSLRFDPSSNIAALKTLKEKGDFKNIDYADLRVENRLYIKNRS